MNENGSISRLIKIFPRGKKNDEESGYFAYRWLTSDFDGQPANRSNSWRVMTIYEANRCGLSY